MGNGGERQDGVEQAREPTGTFASHGSTRQLGELNSGKHGKDKEEGEANLAWTERKQRYSIISKGGK